MTHFLLYTFFRIIPLRIILKSASIVGNMPCKEKMSTVCRDVESAFLGVFWCDLGVILAAHGVGLFFPCRHARAKCVEG
jgi:hypothetical protein